VIGADTGVCLSGVEQFQEGSFVAYTDQVLTCSDCGIDFVFSASEQEFFAQKGFASAPKRCSSCRAQRRAANGGGASYGNGGGASYGNGGGYAGGGNGFRSGPREMFDAVCARCGKDTQVPFRPTGARPVYCSDCFRLMRG
jgi:CxxC-x17-CxxC domain-containing protein